MTEILFDNVQLIDVEKLKPYDKNPRKGNVRAIAESLATNKQYRPIVVQQKTNKILAGNHTWQAAKSLNWEKISVVYVDVDEESAAKIVLADNRTNDLAGYDSEVLAQVLDSITDPTIGTGYSQNDLDIIAKASESAAQLSATLTEITLEDEMDAVRGTGLAPTEFDDEFESEFELDEEDSPLPDIEQDEFEDAQAKLQGVLQLQDDVYWEMGLNAYDIPPIRKDMLLHNLPDPLDTWGGPNASTDDGETTYIWNYGLASPTGLPFDRTILCFYTYDFKFEGWWDKPSYYLSKVLNKGIKMAIAPDYSVWWDDPKTYQIYSIYRAQWSARYFQEAGLRVIPRAVMTNTEQMQKISWMGIPKKAPIISMSMQTMDKNNPEEMKAALDSLVSNCDGLECEKMLVYGGNPAKGICESAQPKVKGTEIIWVRNYAAVRRGVVFDNPDGIEGEKKRIAQELKDAETAKTSRPGGLTKR